uniref:Peptidase S1 domain-containing protein n=1 Tax=Scleropages formosus TaxID=113540 RepID=A0A8C9T2I2_SCLFO
KWVMVTCSPAHISSLSACGQAPLNTGKVSGPVAAPGSWPWVVSMSDTGYFACQGSLINNQWVLTSAYCFVFGRYCMNFECGVTRVPRVPDLRNIDTRWFSPADTLSFRLLQLEPRRLAFLSGSTESER